MHCFPSLFANRTCSQGSSGGSGEGAALLTDSEGSRASDRSSQSEAGQGGAGSDGSSGDGSEGSGDEGDPDANLLHG